MNSLEIEFMQNIFHRFFKIFLKKIIAPNVPQFKGLEMENLQYELKICQKIVIWHNCMGKVFSASDFMIDKIQRQVIWVVTIALVVTLPREY